MGGKLKLKGGELPGVKKKKKKKTTEHAAVEAVLAADGTEDAGKAAADAAAPSTEAAAAGGSGAGAPPLEDRRTEAEKRFEAHLMKYEKQRAEKAASKSHRERIAELNEKLATLTEHHDIPRISYSYM